MRSGESGYDGISHGEGSNDGLKGFGSARMGIILTGRDAQGRLLREKLSRNRKDFDQMISPDAPSPTKLSRIFFAPRCIMKKEYCRLRGTLNFFTAF